MKIKKRSICCLVCVSGLLTLIFTLDSFAYMHTRKRNGPVTVRVYTNTTLSSSGVTVGNTWNYALKQQKTDVFQSDDYVPDWSNTYKVLPAEDLDVIDRGLIDNSVTKTLPFLPQYTNPCWNESLDDLSKIDYAHNKVAQDWYEGLFKAHEQDIASRYEQGQHWRFRCLPYVYVIGFPKCGTSEIFYNVLKPHPQFMKIRKEIHWWNKARFGNRYGRDVTSLQDYVGMFDTVAQDILYRCHGNTTHRNPCITGEASVSTVWSNFIYNKSNPYSIDEPHSLVPGHIHRVTPQARIIVMVRNPTKRLFSDAQFFTFYKENGTRHRGKPVDQFHRDAVHAIDVYNSCAAKHGERVCAYSLETLAQFKVRLHISLYHVFIRDWLEVFGRQQVLVIPLEKYIENKFEYARKIYDFLGLDPHLVNSEEQPLAERKASNQNTNTYRKFGAILPETEKLLNDFFRSHNKQLAELLNDSYYENWQ